MSGVGKSTIGAALAKVLDYRFIDLDQYIINKVHSSLQQIIDTAGEKALLELEEQSMREIDLCRTVIAPGGSVIYLEKLMNYLKKRSTLVFIDDSFENVKIRLDNAADRGIVGYKSKSLREIYDERRPLYIRRADLIINREGKSASQIVSEIKQAIFDT